MKITIGNKKTLIEYDEVKDTQGGISKRKIFDNFEDIEFTTHEDYLSVYHHDKLKVVEPVANITINGQQVNAGNFSDILTQIVQSDTSGTGGSGCCNCSGGKDFEDCAEIDTSISSGFGTYNSNQAEYFQLWAEIINGELKVTLCNRKAYSPNGGRGDVIDQRLSPMGTTAIHLIRTNLKRDLNASNVKVSVGDINYSQEFTVTAFGFNVENAALSFFKVSPNGTKSSSRCQLKLYDDENWFTGQYFYLETETLLNSLELTALTRGDVPEMLIGEFYYYNSGYRHSGNTEVAVSIIDIVVPPAK